MPSEVITVHYTCGCSASGLAPTRMQAGVPKYCPAHGTMGDDMRIPEAPESVDSTDEPHLTDPANPDGA